MGEVSLPESFEFRARRPEQEQKITGGDIFRIESVTTYPRDYAETTEVAAEVFLKSEVNP